MKKELNNLLGFENLFGIGLTKAISLAIFVMLFIVVMKVIFTKHEVPGVTEVVRAV